MKKINAFLLNIVISFTSYLILTSVGFSTLYKFINFADFKVSSWVLELIKILNLDFVQLVFLKSDLYSFRWYLDDSSFIELSYLNYIFYAVFAIGLIIYVVSKRTETRLLKFCYSFFFLTAIFSICINVYNVFDSSIDTSPLSWLLGTFKSLILLLISYVFITKWNSEDVIDIDKNKKLLDFKTFKLKRVKRYKRFMHLVLDAFIMILLFSFFLLYYNVFIQFTTWLELTVGERFTVYILFTFFSIIYYMVFEGILNTTPAKILTNSSLAHLTQSKVTFGTIVARTMSRKIPLNALSFFGDVGWHDQFSKVTVVQNKTRNQNYELVYSFVYLILIVILLTPVLTQIQFRF